MLKEEPRESPLRRFFVSVVLVALGACHCRRCHRILKWITPPRSTRARPLDSHSDSRNASQCPRGGTYIVEKMHRRICREST
jgi:hypothetical protein